ncbi:hypothetical protein GQ55_1G066800 [Panicum hallii var. hallii]|uniref:Uncharacterized protein n=2 Tax=Panicum hallii TaxID=206008 RepID=A0A2T7F2Z0_9POAL|nr:hypothetical protein PAHAL_1G068600 [Panicum hallii]PUZ74452.1 hypothetical protein GQ55_1G066800 [Panicum hallii var. hallii]
MGLHQFPSDFPRSDTPCILQGAQGGSGKQVTLLVKHIAE